MATGDNVLTAISVGRECKIINPTSEVFLADVKNVKGKDVVYWKSQKSSERQLSVEEILNHQQTFVEDELRKTISKSQYKSQIIDEFRNTVALDRNFENDKSVTDIVDLDFLPWNHPPEDYSLALTGKAFNLLVTDETKKDVLKQVLF